MGLRDTARVDVGVLLDVAGRFDAAADVLDGIARAQLAQLTFGGAVAGRAHVARGEAVRRSLEPLGDDVRSWARSCAEIASALRTSATRYAVAEANGAARLG
jgi:Excreted virulence factor EspC, type VII ESX diderm